MKDTRIIFETAKLAKEKGFNERVHYFYKVKSENDIELYGCSKKQIVGFKGHVPIYHKVRDYHTNKEKLNAKLYRCSAPTQSLLAKWLKEEYNIIVLVDYEGIDGYYYKFYSYKEENKNYDASDKNYNTYEEALEAGLQEALKLI